MLKKWKISLLLALVLTFMLSGSVFAFSDLQNEPGKDKIIELKKEGIVSGINDKMFAPKGKVTFAQGVQMIVKGLDLNIDNMRFIKEPKASDYFTNIPDDAWYSKAFMIAQLNGLDLPKDIHAADIMTREQYAHYLFKAVLTKGEYAFIKMYVMIADEDDIDASYKSDIQYVLLAEIAKLDKANKFYPKREITRGEAAVMLSQARDFVKNTKPIEPQEPGTGQQDEVKVVTDKITNDVQKVTLSWGEKPNPGYAITIDRIDFTSDKQAVIYYSFHYPEPGKMYPQMVVEAKAVTYLSTELTPVLKPSVNDIKMENAQQ